MKKVLALAIVVVMLAAMIPFASAASANVYVSVSVDGVLVLAAKPVTSPDGTLAGAVKAANAKYYSGGESGYAGDVDSTYNMFLITKCWGVEAIPYLITNGVPLGADAGDLVANEKVVKDGDNILICTGADATPVGLTATVSGNTATITVMSWSLSQSFTYSSAVVPKAKLTDPATGAVVGTTDAKGVATVTIPASGIVAFDGYAAIYLGSTDPIETTPVVVDGVKANPSPQKVKLAGAAVSCDVYNIAGSNYFKLRDIAMLFNGTDKQFEVGYDSATGITLTTGKAYTALGTELQAGDGTSKTATVSKDAVFVNGEKVELTAYKIAGSNYYKIRDVGTALGFGVDYDQETNTVLLSSK
jgi:hypothetical protein